MPNWCNNTVTIKCDTTEAADRLSAVLSNVKTEGLFTPFVPQPTDTEDWYEWCLANWGTKWDTYDVLVSTEESTSVFILDFQTAWTPPLRFLQTLSTMGCRVDIDFSEFGMGFGGKASYVAGEPVSFEKYDLEYTDDTEE